MDPRVKRVKLDFQVTTDRWELQGSEDFLGRWALLVLRVRKVYQGH